MRSCKQASIACTQVNDKVLKFEDLLDQVLNGAFQMNLPASFKKVKNSFKTAAVEETKHTTAGNVGEGSGGNKKKCKGNNGNGNVENLEQDKDFAMATGEFWKEPFSKQFPQNRPSWEGKVKMCTRWHIKGNCYNNCARVTSHVTNL